MQTPDTLTSDALERFPIRVLSEKTSVGTSTLRAWERRYGLLHPQRTPKGHRLYSEADVRRVRKILDLLNDGHSLPGIAEMLSAKNSAAIIPEPASAGASTNTLSSIWDGFVSATLAATSDFNIERIDGVYNEASSLYPIDMVTDRLILPVLEALGIAWKQHPESGIAEEHFYSSWLKNRLGARFHHAYSQARGARIICACLPGCYHETGLMLFALSALARGYRVLYFGADLPLNQLRYITRRSAAKAVVLGAQSALDKNLNAELTTLAGELHIPVFIGGDSRQIESEAFQDAGGILLGSNIAVALRVFENHVAAYPPAQNPALHREP